MSLLSPPRPADAAAVVPPRKPRRGRPARLMAAGFVAVALMLAVDQLGGLLPSFHNPFRTETVDRSQPAVLHAIEELSRYEAATGHFQVVIDSERDARWIPSFVKGERTLFVAAGTVDAGVDLAQLDAAAVAVSGDRRSVTVTLPRAQLSPPRLDPERSYVVSRDRGLVDRLGSVFADSPTSDRPLYLLADRKLQAAARQAGLVRAAERNTRAMLERLLRGLGFDDVTVTFGPPALS